MAPRSSKPKRAYSKARRLEAKSAGLAGREWELELAYEPLHYNEDHLRFEYRKRRTEPVDEPEYKNPEVEREEFLVLCAAKDEEIDRIGLENDANLTLLLSEGTRNDTLQVELEQARATAAYFQARVAFLESEPAASELSAVPSEPISGSELELATPKAHPSEASVSENSSVATEMYHAELATTAEDRILAHRQRAAVILRLCDCLDAVAKIDDEIHAGAVGESLSEEVESFVRSIRRQAGRIAREA